MLRARPRSLAFSFGVVLGLAAGCAMSPAGQGRTEMQIEDAGAFSRAHTFYILSEANAVTGLGPALDARVRAALERQIRNELEEHGYVYAASGADLKVSYHGVALTRALAAQPRPPVPVAHTPVGPGDPFTAYEPIPGSSEETVGMLLILVVDTHTDAPIWQGTTEGEGTSAGTAVSGAERAARRLLRGIPKAAGH